MLELGLLPCLPTQLSPSWGLPCLQAPSSPGIPPRELPGAGCQARGAGVPGARCQGSGSGVSGAGFWVASAVPGVTQFGVRCPHNAPPPPRAALIHYLSAPSQYCAAALRNAIRAAAPCGPGTWKSLANEFSFNKGTARCGIKV